MPILIEMPKVPQPGEEEWILVEASSSMDEYEFSKNPREMSKTLREIEKTSREIKKTSREDAEFSKTLGPASATTSEAGKTDAIMKVAIDGYDQTNPSKKTVI